MNAGPRHHCLIYEGSPALQLPSVAAVMIEKLKSNVRCLYLNSPTMVAGLRSYVAAGGVNVVAEVKKGSLILTSDQDHLNDGQFDVERMLRMLLDELGRARRDGYAGLWAVGDMMWEFGSEKNLEKLLEYECGLEELLQQEPGIGGICQYHQDILPASAIQAALYTHQSVYLNETLSRLNPFYIQPEALRHDGQAANRVEQMLGTLRGPLTQ